MCLPVDRVRRFGAAQKAPSWRSALDARQGVGTLTNLDPERELSTTLQQAAVATRQLYSALASQPIERLLWKERRPARRVEAGRPRLRLASGG